MASKARMSYEQKRERRVAMSECVASGLSIATVADTYGVCEATIKEACRLAGVAVPSLPRSPTPDSVLVVIANLQNTDDKANEIAERCSCTPSTVREILSRSRQYGLRFPNRPVKNTGNAAVLGMTVREVP